MIHPRPAGSPDRFLPLSLLMSAVRIEFRSDVLVFAAEDAVFGGGACKVPSCRRSARSFRLCQAHHLRWKSQGRPDVESFAATTDPRWMRQRPNRVCQVTDCGYGSSRSGLCGLHGRSWIRSGRPDLEGWLTDPPTVKQPVPGATCLIAHCDLWPRADHPFCHAHTQTWWANNRPAPALFAESFEKDIASSRGESRPMPAT